MIPAIQELNFPKKDGKQYATLTHATATLADMDEKTITTQVKIDGDIVPDFSHDWEVAFQGEKYIMPLRIPQGAKENTSLNSTIDLTFQHWAIYQLKRWPFVTIQPIEAGTYIADEEEATVQLNLKDFCILFGQVLEYYYGGAITIDFNDDPVTGWEYKKEATIITISHTNIWNVLIDAFHDKYGVRWEIVPASDNSNTVKGGERYVIRVGYPTTEVDHIFEYGFEGGLLKLERQVQSEDIRNMIKGRGGETNIPFRYFKNTDPNNPDFKPDPDWVEELANIYFPNLMPATFRSYVQGWKAAHINQTDADGKKIYAGYTPVGESNAYAPWAYRKGYTDTKFHPVEFVADEITANPGDGDRDVEILPGYAPAVKKGSSIDKYGPLQATLDNNDDIYPTIQGTGLDIAVDVEQIESDDVAESVESDAVVSDFEDKDKPTQTVTVDADGRKTVELRSGNFRVDPGKKANLDEGPKTFKIYKGEKHIGFMVKEGKLFLGMQDFPVEVKDYLVQAEDVSLVVVNALTGEERSASGIPPGTYYFRISLTLHNTSKDKLKVVVSCGSPTVTSATLDDTNWRNTFDIWVKNIWGTEKGIGDDGIGMIETDAQYAERVWKPVLGDREGNEAAVVFTSGALAHEDYEFKIPKGAWPVYDTSKTYKDADGVTHTSHWRIKLAKSDAELEATGLYVPSTQKQGKAGDTFAFIGTEMTHVPYVVKAEERLDDWKKDHLGEVKEIKPTFVVTTDRVRLNNEGRPDALINQLRAGNSLRIADKRFIQPLPDMSYDILYLQSITYTYREPSSNDAALNPDVEIVLSDEYATSANPVSVMQGEISSIQRQLGSVSNVEQIVRVVGDKLYLRKDGISDRSLSPTQFFSLLTSGDFRAGVVGGQGWGFYKDENGNWVLEADRVNVRQEMLVNTLVINQAEGKGGMEIDTAAKLEVTRVVETDNGYVCYFDQKDGSVANLFRIDDVAYCNRWTPENAKLKFYKRRVVAVGVDNITLTKGYDPVELPDGTIDTGVNGTGIPADKDNIIHFGNYTDKNRQYVKVRDVVGGGYASYLWGLDSVNAPGREYVYIGRRDGESPRFFVGDRDAGQFVEYKDGKLVVCGELRVEGQPLQSYLSDNIGGTNLLRGTARFIDPELWHGTERVYADVWQEWQGAICRASSKAYTPVQVFRDVAPREKYTFSAWIKVDDPEMPSAVIITTYTTSGDYVPDMSAEAQKVFVTGSIRLGEWCRIKGTFVAGLDEMLSGLCIGLRIVGRKYGGHVYIGGFKLERGEVATGWSRNPSDNDTSGFDYLRESMKQATSVKGGLVQTSVVQLGQAGADGGYEVWAGTNGMYNGGGTPAFFAGGEMADMFDMAYTGTRPATYLVRMDGTGYAAGGVIRFMENALMVGEYTYMNKDGFSIRDDSGQTILNLSNKKIATLDELRNPVSYPYRLRGPLNLVVRHGPEGFNIRFSDGSPRLAIALFGNARVKAGSTLTMPLMVSLPLGNAGIAEPDDPWVVYGRPKIYADIVRVADDETVFSTSRTLKAADMIVDLDIFTVLDEEGQYRLELYFAGGLTTNPTEVAISGTILNTVYSISTATGRQTLMGNNGFATVWKNTMIYADEEMVVLRAGNFTLRLHKDSGFGYNTDGTDTFKPLNWT